MGVNVAIKWRLVRHGYDIRGVVGADPTFAL